MVNWIRKDVHIIYQKHLETSETKNPSGSTFNPPGSIWVPISKPKPDPLSPSDFGPATEIHDRIHIIFLHHLDVRLTRPMLCPCFAFGILEKVLMRKTLQNKIKHSNTKSPIHWCCSLQSLRLYRTYYCHVSLPESIMIYSIGILYVELGQVQFNRIHRAEKVPRFWDSYHSYPNPSPIESNSVRLRAFEVKSRRIEPG